VAFDVWAPLPSKVELGIDGTRIAMERDGEWWRAPAGTTGDRYGYYIDGGDTLVPDPRSRRQPEGVHKASETFDELEYDWKDADWNGRQLAGGVIYELHIGTFTPEGTLDSAIEKLDYLVDLGIDFVEVLPVNAFNGTHNWGYDGVLWYAVTESYGGPAAYQRFVDAAHARGLAIVQDVVYNHLGPSGNYLPQFGPYLHDASSNTWGASLNLENYEVRRYIIENALMWFRDYHVDALRLDAVHALVDTSPVHILEELATEVDVLSAFLGRPLTLIAESDLNDTKLVSPREANGYGLTSQWSDDYHHSVHVALTGETTGYYEDFASLGALAKVSTAGFFHDGTYSSFRERNHGHPVDPRMPTWRLVTFAQDHDQIGNRAIGDRLSASLDVGQLAIAAVLVLAGPYTPMLFMGEEWGATTPWQFFTSHPEPELGKATAEGRIAEFEKMGWDPDVVPDPQDPATFENSKLNWDESTTGDHALLLEVYRSLARLRHSVPELTTPQFSALEATYSDGDGWFRLDRGDLSILVNFAAHPNEFRVVGEVLLDTARLLQTSYVMQRDGVTMLESHSAAIIRRS
jgi:maltooligosyltrehalose trehalohydrolase